jgi:uncharacterized protein (DUF362 family)
MNNSDNTIAETPKPDRLAAAREVLVLRRDSLTYDNVAIGAAAIYEQAGQSLHHHWALHRQRLAQTRPTIFLLCNFVYHKRPNETWDQFRGKTTQCEVLYPLIEQVLAVYGPEVRIRIGNAPLQGASWERLIEEVGLSRLVAHFRERLQTEVIELCDLRLHVRESNGQFVTSRVRAEEEYRSDQCVLVDLAGKSLLEEVTAEETAFRVLDYGADRITRCHRPGKHVYIIARKVLESDLIISVPKLKTHEKVGITAGIKGCVGTIAHKDCLPHHRKGSAADGGDEYQRPSRLRRLLSDYHDFVNRLRPSMAANCLLLTDRVFRKLHSRGKARFAAGSWSGNDTAWRMSLDLARISLYATRDGQMADEPVRRHFVLTDGVIAGEGQGPLDVEPVHFGYLSWSEDLAAGDVVNSAAMGMNLAQLPIVRNAFCLSDYPLTALSTPDDVTLSVNGRAESLAEFRRSEARKFRMPRGW